MDALKPESPKTCFYTPSITVSIPFLHPFNLKDRFDVFQYLKSHVVGLQFYPEDILDADIVLRVELVLVIALPYL